MMKDIVSPATCPCGLPLTVFQFMDDVPFDATAWMLRACPEHLGMCCLRKAAMKAIFAAE